MGILLTKAGWQTMVMDQGRKFTRHLGIPASGVTDLFHYWWANGLVGGRDFQNAGPPVLEIRSGAVEIVFEAVHKFALTGSSGQFFLDGRKIPAYSTLLAQEGQVLRIDTISRNGTVYLAIDGEWNVDYAYGSASADILSPFPGTAGRRLKNNCRLEIRPKKLDTQSVYDTPEYMKRPYQGESPVLRLSAGPELNINDQIKKSLLENTFWVTRNSNRMAYRLKTESGTDDYIPSMISSVVLPGMIQWPSADQPILLLPNCQTTGGYPRVAKVIDADIWKLAYIGPGDGLRFKWATHQEAIYLRQYQLGQFIQAWSQTFDKPIRHHLLRY